MLMAILSHEPPLFESNAKNMNMAYYNLTCEYLLHVASEYH